MCAIRRQTVCRAEAAKIQRIEVFANSLWPFSGFDVPGVLIPFGVEFCSTSICHERVGIDEQALTANRALFDASRSNRLGQPLRQFAVGPNRPCRCLEKVE
jgi:hypothetical protein